jgi:hypothetical protein
MSRFAGRGRDRPYVCPCGQILACVAFPRALPSRRPSTQRPAGVKDKRKTRWGTAKRKGDAAETGDTLC